MRAVRSTIKERRRSRHPFEARPRVNTARGRQSQQPLAEGPAVAHVDRSRKPHWSTLRGARRAAQLCSGPAIADSNATLITKPARPQLNSWVIKRQEPGCVCSPQHERPGARKCRASPAGGSSNRENGITSTRCKPSEGQLRAAHEQVDSEQSRNQPNRPCRGPALGDSGVGPKLERRRWPPHHLDSTRCVQRTRTRDAKSRTASRRTNSLAETHSDETPADTALTPGRGLA